jgi:16S rRNA (cytosine967-C5)-methyltransferase
MTPAARVQAAIEVLEALNDTNRAADRVMRDWFRARRYAGSKDRAAIGERVFMVLRHRASLAWRMQDERPRALVIGNLLADGCGAAEIEALFSGTGYGPAPLTEAERAALAREDIEPRPLWVQGEFPAFLHAELVRGLGDNLFDEANALNERAPVDLRVNTLKATRDDVLRELEHAGFAVEPTPYSPFGLRLSERDRASQLRASRAFLQGRFEFQDESAQMAAVLCAAKPGETILDIAAGAGGKALALAATMNNRGLIVARDNDAARLAQLAPRALRAGVTIIREQLAVEEMPEGKFDAVFVDAPCSGSGAWRRQPEQKWRLTSERLMELQNTQDRLLEQAAAAARERIVYATCSILMCENEDRIESFLSRHPDFRVPPAASIWRERTGTPPPPGMDKFFKATPRTTGTDGFFTAVLMRAME